MCLDDETPPPEAAFEMAANSKGRSAVCFDMFAERAVWIGTDKEGGREEEEEAMLSVRGQPSNSPSFLPSLPTQNNAQNEQKHVGLSSTTLSARSFFFYSRHQTSNWDSRRRNSLRRSKRLDSRRNGIHPSKEREPSSKTKTAVQTYSSSSKEEGGVSSCILEFPQRLHELERSELLPPFSFGSS